MSLFRPHFISLILAVLLLEVGPSFAQQARPVPPLPSTEAGKPSAPKGKSIDVPMLDEPPSLTLPLPKSAPLEPAKETGNTPAPPNTLEPAPLPSLRPVQPTVAAPNPNATGSSTSELGQFVIHGADLESRTFINKICEETAEQMSMLLRDTAKFEIPIVVSVKTPPNVSPNGAAVTTDIAQLAFGGFRLQITIQVRPDFNVGDFREELVRMLLAERILRNHKELTTTRDRILPDWLLVGVKEAMRYRSRSRPSAIFAAVFRTGKVYGIEEILGTSPGSLDALSRTLYETSCCALVLALIEQPEGNLRMAKFLSALCTESKSDREMLNKWFPGMNASKSSLNKWWSLQMANLATPSVFETLGPSETAKELDQALMIHYETTPADVPAPQLASAEDETLKADAETEAKKRGFFGRLFTSDKASKAYKPGDETLLKEETKVVSAKPEPAASKPDKPKAEKPKKKEQPVVAQEAAAPEDNPVPEKSGFRLRKMFGFGSGDNPAAIQEPKPELKEDKPKPEAKKEDKPKPEAKKEDKPKPEAKKEDKPKVPAKKEDKPKPEPVPEEKPKADAASGENEKRPGFFGRMFGGKKEDKSAEPVPETDKKEKPKSKKTSSDDKPSAAVFDHSMMLRIAADFALPSTLTMAFDSSAWLQGVGPRYVAFLGLGKKKDKPAAEGEEAPKAEPKAEPQKKESQPEPKKAEKPKVKKERLVSVSIPLSDYARVIKRSDSKKILNATATNIAALINRAHPLFRPLIKDYNDLVLDLANHKTKDADARIKELRARRDQVLTQAKAVRDYLDYFEASVSNEYSGLFDDYLRVPKTIDQEIPRRTDAISKAVDEVEKQMAK